MLSASDKLAILPDLSVFQSVADLHPVVLLDEAKCPATRFGWTLGLFFDEGGSLERRLAANGVMRDFLAAFPGQITHYHPDGAGSLVPIGSTDISAASDQAAKAATRKDGRDANDRYATELYGFHDGVR